MSDDLIPLVVMLEDAETGRQERFAFLRSPVRIGRGELNDLPLDRPFVSTYHGMLQFDGEGVRYVDLGSTNGSNIDGTPVERNQVQVLGVGSQIEIGTLRLKAARRVTRESSQVPRAQTAFALMVQQHPDLSQGSAANASAPVVAPAAPPTAAPPSLEGVAVDPGPVLDPEAEARAEAALDEAALDLDLEYASYRGTWEQLRTRFEQLLAGVDERARAALVGRLSARYEAAVREPQWRALAGLEGAMAAPSSAPERAPAVAVRPPEGSRPGAPEGGAALGLLRLFCESYLPASVTLREESEVQAVFGRLAAALEAFSKSFLELRTGYEEFGKEMGVRAVHPEGGLARARDSAALLSYLLDPRGQGREAELQRAFADFMIHQMALLRGVVTGSQAVLDRLSPEEFTAQASGVWPIKVANQWKAFEERFQELREDENELSGVLFGREFAMAYADIAGQRAEKSPGRKPKQARGDREE